VCTRRVLALVPPVTSIQAHNRILKCYEMLNDEVESTQLKTDQRINNEREKEKKRESEVQQSLGLRG
jgi:hypothetical protein